MKSEMVISLDVGGSYIKTAIIENGVLIEELNNQFESKSSEEKDTILDHFVNIINIKHADYLKFKKLSGGERHIDKRIGIGFAFPGPFDYKRGISYIKGLNKFESLYGVNVLDEIIKRLQKTELSYLNNNITIMFENDARLFGLGVSGLYPDERLICLTIGTGLGSAFVEKGQLLTSDERIPKDGYLYNQIYNNSMVDDLFSKRGIINAARKTNKKYSNMDVKELAELARYGNKDLIYVFDEFGRNLGKMLLPFVTSFKPDRIVIGGQISKSLDLFYKSFIESYENFHLQITSNENVLKYTHLGIYKMIKDYWNQLSLV